MTRCDDVLFSEPIWSYFEALDLMRINAYSRDSSVGIPSAWEERNPLKSTIFA